MLYKTAAYMMHTNIQCMVFESEASQGYLILLIGVGNTVHFC